MSTEDERQGGRAHSASETVSVRLLSLQRRPHVDSLQTRAEQSDQCSIGQRVCTQNDSCVSVRPKSLMAAEQAEQRQEKGRQGKARWSVSEWLNVGAMACFAYAAYEMIFNGTMWD